MADVIRTVSEVLPENGIVTNGAGNFAAFVHRYFQYKGYRTCLAPTSGSMGYGMPAAIAAKLAHPTRPVVNVQGDGDFLMTGQELATAAQYGLPIVTIIANNGMYGTIRMHQEREYPRPHRRHDPHQPRLCRLRPQLRRRRLHHRGHRRLRARLPPGAGEQQAVRDRAQARPRGADRAPDAVPDPRRGAPRQLTRPSASAESGPVALRGRHRRRQQMLNKYYAHEYYGTGEFYSSPPD